MLEAYAHLILYIHMFNLFHLCLASALDLDRMPAKNEMVACRFLADGNYYRAKVLDVGKETVKVTYVDFGNQDCVTKDKLKPLPESLKRVRLK